MPDIERIVTNAEASANRRDKILQNRRQRLQRILDVEEREGGEKILNEICQRPMSDAHHYEHGDSDSADLTNNSNQQILSDQHLDISPQPESVDHGQAGSDLPANIMISVNQAHVFLIILSTMYALIMGNRYLNILCSVLATFHMFCWSTGPVDWTYCRLVSMIAGTNRNNTSSLYRIVRHLMDVICFIINGVMLSIFLTTIIEAIACRRI